MADQTLAEICIPDTLQTPDSAQALTALYTQMRDAQQQASAALQLALTQQTTGNTPEHAEP